MPATTVKSARKNLKSLVRDVTSDTVAVEIVGEQDNAVLISLARYTALREATFLLRSPELMESLRREAARSLMPPAPGDDFVDTVVHDTIADATAADRAVASSEKPEPKRRTRKKRKKKRSRRR
ncbi:MAG: prevent-host-death family protein [Rhodococcus sp. (in: high G+C Gram-positive bacteria)]|uniref:type II toxin-antitoxin system Phd/YefM family antitoxin n=1 Tax=Rhodococcus sp. TaxID=1831 RepID=UPI003BB58316